MSWSIHHKSSVCKYWFVFNLNRKFSLNTFFVFVSWTLKRLKESLKSSNHSNISLWLQMRFCWGNIETVTFFFGCKGTFKLRCFNLDGEFVFDSQKFNIIQRTENQVSDFAIKSFELLIVDDFFKMCQFLWVWIDNMIKNLARVLKNVRLIICFIALDLFGHGEEV